MGFPSHDPNVWLWELQDWFRDYPDYRPPPPTPVLSSAITGSHEAYCYFMERTPPQEEEEDYRYQFELLENAPHQDAWAPTASSHRDSGASVDHMYRCSPRPGSSEPESSSTMRVYDGTEENFLSFLAETSEPDADATVGGTVFSDKRWVPLSHTAPAGGTGHRQDVFDFSSTWPEKHPSNHVRSAELSATSSLTGALGPSVSKDARRSPDAIREATPPPILRKSQKVAKSSKKSRSSASKRVRFVAEVGSAMSQEHAGAPRGSRRAFHGTSERRLPNSRTSR
ncbi:hypothetical protein FIBSPDRAFT_895008 [Athelia psychrophila]|uniref:Uncharacterized protein n=1 Tax=Athelia psychrophila TaxID=1759441 RepID=A0A166F404_9AGAM|nr:hypothetical protein FIBSPDRAFT_900692 [Fibularhizoctonia sp. CBS 109695]KZP16411.1 hypothetical protein FIBSPDRAFT_895008 [Fibularhizoctonia sp. CBS 109695]